MAEHDRLTGVMNRRRFRREMAGRLARGERYGAVGALLMIDLANFKFLNDNRGQSAGDELIIRIAHALHSRLRTSDVLARLGGDEFIVLLPVADEQSASNMVETLLNVVRREANALMRTMSKKVTASVGLASFSKRQGWLIG
jgi:diguanylate cyclase (GGDEF)-like protein